MTTPAAPPFDLVDPATQADPFGAYARLRSDGTVHLLDETAASPTYLVSGYSPARAVLGDAATFSSRLLPLPVMLFLDPPDHDRIRRTVARAFTPKAVSSLEPRIDSIAADLLDAFVGRGSGDIVEAVSGRLPVYVIGEVLGVPTDDWEQLRSWSEATVRALSVGAGAGGEDADAAIQGALALHGYLDGVVERHHQHPEGTIAGQLAAFERAGDIDRAELVGFLQLMFVAGHETTTSLLTRTIELFATDHNLFDRVRADRSLVGPLVEEVLRTYGPLQRLFRVAKVDTVVDGVAIPANSTVVVLIGAANRDRDRFPAGDDLDLDAADASHLAFGQGIHHCLGAPLARLEARVALGRLLDVAERIDLDPDRPPTRFSGGTTSELQTTSLGVVVTPATDEVRR